MLNKQKYYGGDEITPMISFDEVKKIRGVVAKQPWGGLGINKAL